MKSNPWIRRACFMINGLLWGAAASAAPALVTVDNQTKPTACAEEDNVSLVLDSPGLRRFRVEALPPVYLASIRKDITAPDFSNCNFDGSAHPTDPKHSFTPRTQTLHDGKRWKIVGMTLPSFWRPQEVPVTVDGRADKGFHMIQVYAKTARKPLEALVMYPADGYWRIKPLPPARFGDGVYGSSFVMGPIEDQGRPVASITAIRIATHPLSFHLRFADGSGASVKVTEVSEARTALDVSLEPAGKPIDRFAVLRSMYVAADNADVSEVSWRDAPQSARQSLPLPDVTKIRASELRFGRKTPSRHNTSAPDIRFSGFDGAPASKQPR